MDLGVSGQLALVCLQTRRIAPARLTPFLHADQSPTCFAAKHVANRFWQQALLGGEVVPAGLFLTMYLASPASPHTGIRNE
jgi:hypothetical protein